MHLTTIVRIFNEIKRKLVNLHTSTKQILNVNKIIHALYFTCVDICQAVPEANC